VRPRLPSGPATTRKGRVTLVGAGPGDPDLLTVRAVRALEDADVVLFDALCDPRLLALCPRAKRLYVGKRAGRAHVKQETIGRLLVRYARRGLAVVRLKAGDPFVFGRGGEEVLHVQSAGFPVEVVPGLTSAFAAPLAAGIPVTHREVSRGVLVMTAVPDDGWRALVGATVGAKLTWVFLMGVERRSVIARAFLDAGHSPDLGAALVFSASTPEESSRRLLLADLEVAPLAPHERGLPGVLVLGDVTRIGEARQSLMFQEGGAA